MVQLFNQIPWPFSKFCIIEIIQIHAFFSPKKSNRNKIEKVKKTNKKRGRKGRGEPFTPGQILAHGPVTGGTESVRCARAKTLTGGTAMSGRLPPLTRVPDEQGIILSRWIFDSAPMHALLQVRASINTPSAPSPASSRHAKPMLPGRSKSTSKLHGTRYPPADLLRRSVKRPTLPATPSSLP
jgi:hypothetical protein